MSEQTALFFQEVEQIVDQFPVYGDVKHIQPFGTGHINDTFAITVGQGRAQIRYVLQRINGNVFKNIPALQENIARVTDHIREKLKRQHVQDISGRVLHFLPTADGKNWVQDDDGSYWRLCPLIERARVYDVLESATQAEMVARAFGEFQLQLADLDASVLAETIPEFHHGPGRRQQFIDALEADEHNRAATCRAEIDFLTDHFDVFDVFPAAFADGSLPLRTTHNDTKCNNVMVDEQTGQSICVLDLDTVMPGSALYDFGDMVRTATNPAAEDERDLSLVRMDIDYFTALVRGYLSCAGGFLNDTERELLPFSGKLLTLMIGSRFLTDHLRGDTYFRIHRPNHNLDRCRTQFKLVESIEAQEESMATVVDSVWARRR